MNKEIINNSDVSRKPFNKAQIEWWTNRIDNLTREKRRSLESEFESHIQAESKKNMEKFINTLKINKELESYKNAYSKYEKTIKKESDLNWKHEAELRKIKEKHKEEENKLKQIKVKENEELEKAQEELTQILDNWEKIRGWQVYLNYDSPNKVNATLTSCCYEETKKAFYKSKAGKELKQIDDVRLNILDNIYSNNLDQNILTVIGVNLASIGINTQLQITN